MASGELLTRGTVWLALSLYVFAEAMRAGFLGSRAEWWARWLSTLGALVFAGHVAAAFHHYHDWSHAAAYAETARQTAEFSGWNWGGGLYLNYFFTLLWLTDVGWWWVSPQTRASRSLGFDRAGRAFFLFMIFNGAVLFVRNPMRWYGLIICLILVVCWWRMWKRPGANATASTTT
jgi:hypothetical protein